MVVRLAELFFRRRLSERVYHQMINRGACAGLNFEAEPLHGVTKPRRSCGYTASLVWTHADLSSRTPGDSICLLINPYGVSA